MNLMRVLFIEVLLEHLRLRLTFAPNKFEVLFDVYLICSVQTPRSDGCYVSPVRSNRIVDIGQNEEKQ
jgi:hypothetical protein